MELVEDPSEYIVGVLDKVKPEYLSKTYKVSEWKDAPDFLEKVAQKTGKLLKGGEPDLNTVSKTILNDFQRGKLPYFIPPPGCELRAQEDANVIGEDFSDLKNIEPEQEIDNSEEVIENNDDLPENSTDTQNEEKQEVVVRASGKFIVK